MKVGSLTKQFCDMPSSCQVISRVIATGWDVQLVSVPCRFEFWPGATLLGTKPSWVMAAVPVQEAVGWAAAAAAGMLLTLTPSRPAAVSERIRVRIKCMVRPDGRPGRKGWWSGTGQELSG